MPDAAGRMLDQLAVSGDSRGFACLDEDFTLAPGTALPKPEGVFPRYVDAAEEGEGGG